MNKKVALVKDVCKKCRNENKMFVGFNFDGGELTQFGPPMPWRIEKEKGIASDEDYWDEEQVDCPFDWMTNSIHEIPQHCPYKLEHMVLKKD